MTDANRDVLIPKHPISCNDRGSIQIDHFSDLKPEKCFCTFAEGHRYYEHGIATGSVLLCQRKAIINDGDLVLVDVDGILTIYQYRRDRKIKSDGEKRILHNKSKAYAKILGSFNIFN